MFMLQICIEMFPNFKWNTANVARNILRVYIGKLFSTEQRKAQKRQSNDLKIWDSELLCKEPAVQMTKRVQMIDENESVCFSLKIFRGLWSASLNSNNLTIPIQIKITPYYETRVSGQWDFKSRVFHWHKFNIENNKIRIR